jgi:hypothetical protein
MKKLLTAVALALAVASPWAPPAVPAARAPRVEPVKLAVNTDDDEDDPHLAPDGLTLYYAAKRKGKWEVMFATRKKDTDPWGKGEVLQDWIRTDGDDRSPCVTTSKRYPQYLYFASTTEKERKTFDLFVAVKHGAGKAFTEPRALFPLDTEADKLHPWLTDDGKELYFSRMTDEGWRLFVARRKQAAGPAGFGRPDPVDELPPNFHHATLTSDGCTMYLQGPVGEGRWGLYVFTRSRGGPWGKLQRLDVLNDPDAPTGDRSPALSRDGKRLYFTSDRPKSKGLDLWTVPTALLR